MILFRLSWIVVACLLIPPFLYGQTAPKAPATPAPAQEYCPVLPTQKIDPAVFVEYQGKRVYFCCANCQGEFEKNPEAYLAHLPQFGAAPSLTPTVTSASAPAPTPAASNKPRTFKSKVVRPLGIASLSLLFLTALLGYFTRRHYKSLFPWHQRLAVTALIAAACHGGVVLFF